MNSKGDICSKSESSCSWGFLLRHGSNLQGLQQLAVHLTRIFDKVLYQLTWLWYMYHCTVSPYRRNCMQENAKVEHWHAHCKLRAVQVSTSATRKDALGKAPHRAFAYAQFCNGKAYKECWTSEKVTFSFSLMVEGLSLTLNCKSLRHFVNFALPYWPYFFCCCWRSKI